MEFTIYETKTRKVKGEDTDFLSLVAEISDFDNLEEALEALLDEVPEYLGVELTVYSQEPTVVTVNENPSKYAFNVNGGGVNVALEAEQEDEEDEPEAEEEEEEAPPPKPRSRQRGRASSGTKRTTAASAKQSGKKASPFRSNPKSAE